MIKDKTKGVLAVTATYTIYGINTVLCKDLTNSDQFSPFVLFSMRAAGAAILFLLASFSIRGEHIEKDDRGKLVAASLLGIVIPQLSTLWGLTMSTPYDASIINTLKPLLTMFVAAIILKEKMQWRNIISLTVGLSGALVLVLPSIIDREMSFGTSPLGFAILMLNGLSFSLYLVLFRPLTMKYHPVIYMKWMFVIAFLFSLPASLPFIISDGLPALGMKTISELAFLIFFATFLTYFLMPVGQKNMHPVKYSLFSYIQPLAAALFSILCGLDAVTWYKVVATILITSSVLTYIDYGARQSLGSSSPK